MSDRIVASVNHDGCNFGSLEYIGGIPNNTVVFELSLEGAFDSYAIFSALDMLFWESYKCDFKVNPIKVVITFKNDSAVRNAQGFTRMWARKIATLGKACHEDYLKQLDLEQNPVETVHAYCICCDWQGQAHYGTRSLDEASVEMFELHFQNNPTCTFLPLWD